MGFGKLEFIGFILCSFCLHESSSSRKTALHSPLPNNTCNFTPLQRAIYQLQGQVDKGFNILRQELSTSSSNIDYHNKEIQAALGECRNDINKFMETRTRRHSDQPQRGLRDTYSKDNQEDVSQRLQNAALGLIHADLEIIKQNLSKIADVADQIWERMSLQDSIQNIFKMPSDQNSISPPRTHPKSCKEIKQQNSNASSSIYVIQPENSKGPFMVFCEMVVEGGGWLAIHNRYDGTQDFDLDWDNYKQGFGNIAGEYWLGLEKIYQLTGSHLNELLVQVVDSDMKSSIAHYAFFSIGSEEEGYPLKVLGGVKGDAGDYLSYSAGSKFSTKDKDQDSWAEGSCAQSHSGGWWYKACDKCNLNAKYLPGEQPDQFLYKTMYWNAKTSASMGLLQSRMMIRPREDVIG